MGVRFGVQVASPSPALYSKNWRHEILEALACLSSFSGAHENSIICAGGTSDPLRDLLVSGRLQPEVRACRHGLVPMGGMTYLFVAQTFGISSFGKKTDSSHFGQKMTVQRSHTFKSHLSSILQRIFISWSSPPRLGSLQWHLGEFLALTGWELRGSDLICLDLVEHWLAPDALPFMELTSEKQLEVETLGELLRWLFQTSIFGDFVKERSTECFFPKQLWS